MTVTTPIRIYMHLWAINHWKEIFVEQMTAMKESGLYDACEGIYIGLMVNQDNQQVSQSSLLLNRDNQDIMRFINDYDKTEILAVTNENLHEFHTLRILKDHADKSDIPIFALYINNKGVSRTHGDPLYEGGTFWRHYMTDWMITRWRINYKALSMKYRGYDIAGVNMRNARESVSSNRVHASGNWWMANSDYIKTLGPVESMPQARHEAEMWAFTGDPIIFMPCNLFVDYICSGRYKDFAHGFDWTGYTMFPYEIKE